MSLNTTTFKDIAERTIATAIEAALAYAATRLVDVGPQWVLIGTPALAAIKSWVATKFGTGTASAVK